MTIDNINGLIGLIMKNKHDDEYAHSLEDDLHIKILKEVAKGNPDSQKMAKLGLKTLEINFNRWAA